MKWTRIPGANALLFIALSSAFAELPPSQVLDRQIASRNFALNKTGVSPVRKMAIYLTPGYGASSSRYPVIYFFPNPFEDSHRFDFDHKDAQGLFDRAIGDGVIGGFILVAVDMNNPAWKFVVCELAIHWQLGRFHRSGTCAIRGHEFQNLTQQGLTRHRRNFHRRIWGHPPCHAPPERLRIRLCHATGRNGDGCQRPHDFAKLGHSD